MKLFLIKSKKFLGPGTPYEGMVREQNKEKAYEAFINPQASPFDGVLVPMTKFWYEAMAPKPSHFSIKEVGKDDRWPDSFSDELRDPEKNTGPAFSSEEKSCRDFLEDRIIMRNFTSGGGVDRFMFAFKLWLAKRLRDWADWIDENAGITEKEKKEIA